MLYSVIALSFFMPVMCYISFVKGYNIAAVKSGEKPIMRKPKKIKHECEYETLMKNIENYDGTGNGQVKI